MKFDIGGGIIASMVDVVMPMFTRFISRMIEYQVINMVQNETIPNMVNIPMIQNHGFANISNFFAEPDWNNTAMDMQVDKFEITHDSLL